MLEVYEMIGLPIMGPGAPPTEADEDFVTATSVLRGMYTDTHASI